MYSVYLRTQGLRVVLAADGGAAVRMAVASRPDVIVMDLGLPVIHGAEAIRQLKRHRGTARIPIIVCTGRKESAYAKAAGEAGCDAYLVKPCLPEHLLNEIRTVLARASGQRQA